MKYSTLILHNGNETDKNTGALNIPIYQTSTFHQNNKSHSKYMYTRSENPTREALENTIATLESAKYGYAFSSGMAAIASSLSAFLQNGDHVVATQDIYGGTYRILTSYFDKFGIDSTFVDMTNLENVEKALRPNTKVLFLETPSNPLLQITDIKKCVALAKKYNILTMIDNTFMSPYFQRPLELGVDISIHSATKFLCGHSDVISGLVVTDNEELAKRIYFVQNTFGAVLSPQESFLLLRGIKTLKVRMEEQQKSAFKIAMWLKDQKWIRSVYFPGLKDHPGHDLHNSQSSGAGCVLSFTTETLTKTMDIINNVKICSYAVSLGGVETILSYPTKMSHASIPTALRESLGITENLLRLSVGLEDPDDIINDLCS